MPINHRCPHFAGQALTKLTTPTRQKTLMPNNNLDEQIKQGHQALNNIAAHLNPPIAARPQSPLTELQAKLQLWQMGEQLKQLAYRSKL